jgi:mycothiol system anti-sigma-R factor
LRCWPAGCRRSCDVKSLRPEFTVLQRRCTEKLVVTFATEGNPRMLCDDVKRVVYFFLDGSLGSQKRTDLETHLGHCPDCEVRIVVQRRLREFVRARLTPLQAPDHLRVRLTETIRQYAPAAD